MNAGKMAAFMVGFAFGRKGWGPMLHAFYWSAIILTYYFAHRP